MTRVLLSYAYPPFEAPRAVQVERLARHMATPVEVFCGEVERISGPLAGEPPEPGDAVRVTRVRWGPWARRRRTLHAKVLRGRIDVPDRYRPWAADATRTLLRRTWQAGDVLVTFGQPWSDHLVGLRVARRAGVPWVAHFSDPWIANPLAARSPAVRPFDARLERAVVRAADRLVFTNDEAMDLVMDRYPRRWRAKAHVVPHAFEPGRHAPSPGRDPGAPLVARYVGAFYGERTPRPLLGALGRLAREDPAALEDLRVELVGPSDTPLDKLPEIAALPDGLVGVHPPVDHEASLRIMATADLLLVVDAPAQRSPFLPSKLVEYLGAGRPIAALSPPGPSAELVRRLGGWVADPAHEEAAARALADAVRFAREAPDGAWGDPAVRGEYEAGRVAAAFDAVLADAATGSAN